MKKLIKTLLREQRHQSVLLVFGGLHYATPEWMYQQIPAHIKESKTVITKSYDSNIPQVIDELNKIDYNNLEVVGFSAGGLNVFKLAPKIEIDLLVLLDPTVPKNWSLDGFPSNSILFFNSDTWEDLPTIQERQRDLKEAMIDKGMIVEKTDLIHKDFPKIFFETYM